jgi:hypothetical protein
MNDLDSKQLSAALVIGDSFLLRWIALEEPTFDRLKTLQRNLEGRIRRDTSNAEVLKYLLHTHPEAQQAAR